MTRIHRNLHASKAGTPQWVQTVKGRVDAYLPAVDLLDVSTRVQAGGVARCQATGVRKVVAFFDGELGQASWLDGEWHLVSFDPRHDTAFHTAVSGLWNRADAARLTADGLAYVLNPRWEN